MSRNKKNNVYPCKPQFYYIKMGLRGSKLYRHVFVMNCIDVYKIHTVETRHLIQIRVQEFILSPSIRDFSSTGSFISVLPSVKLSSKTKILSLLRLVSFINLYRASPTNILRNHLRVGHISFKSPLHRKKIKICIQMYIANRKYKPSHPGHVTIMKNNLFEAPKEGLLT